MAGLTALDIVVLLALLFGTVTGGLRGFVQESLSLAALIVALFAVRLFHEPVTMWLYELVGTEAGAGVLAFALIMGVIWGGGKFAAARIGGATRKSMVGPVDRILGAGFGALKALLIVTAIFMVVTLGYDMVFGKGSERPGWMAESRSFPLLSATGSALSDIVAERLDDEPAAPAALMSSTLYTTDILRLALGAAMHPRLAAPHGSAEQRTPVCGSKIVMDVALDGDGRLASVGMDVHACAMGQAAAGLFAAAARGCDRGDVLIARNALAEWLAGDRAVPPDWPGIEALVEARAYPARHAAILLPFNAASQAIADAAARRERGGMSGDGLIEATILLGAAMLFVLLFRRIGLGAVLGYLVAGALVGPQGLGLVGGGEQKLAFAEIGIAMLLFLVGLELNPERLWRMKREIFGLGLAQVLACGVALTGFLLAATGFTWQAVVVLAFPLALSSTAQVLPSLKSSGRINSPFGERAFSILLFQDLSIVPLITLVAILSRAPPDPAAPPGWTLGLYTVAAVIGLVLAGRFVMTPLLKLVGRIGERELFVVVGLFAVLGSAGLMHMLHLSVALGAFVAGVMLADSPYRHELEADVEPFRSILLGLFFLAVGMVLDLQVVAERPLTVIGLAAGLVAIKTVAIWGVARLFGMGWRPALGLALLLSQGGEFGFVLFAQAADAQLISPEAASLFGAVVTLSMATTPFLMLFARFLEYSRSDEAVAADKAFDGPELAPNGRAIVVGHGRFGQIVSQMLNAVDCSVTLIDKKPAAIETSGRFDVKVYYGDGLRLDVLRHAGAEEAQVIALCIDDRSYGAEQIEPIMHAFPQAKIFARAYDRRQMMALAPAEPHGAVRETFESAMAMALMAAEAVGTAPDDINDAERAVRHLDDKRLAMQIDAGDLSAGADLRFRAGGNQRPREILDRIADRLRKQDE